MILTFYFGEILVGSQWLSEKSGSYSLCDLLDIDCAGNSIRWDHGESTATQEILLEKTPRGSCMCTCHLLFSCN